MRLAGESSTHASALVKMMAVIILSIWSTDAFAFTPSSLTHAKSTGSRRNNDIWIGTIHEHHGKQPSYNIASSYKSMSMSSSVSSVHQDPLPKLDRVLSKLTSLFPLFVLGSALLGEFNVIIPWKHVHIVSQFQPLCAISLGSFVPKALNWVNTGNYISLMLAG